MQFLAPAMIGDEITAMVEVIDFPKDKRVVLKTVCTNQDGEEIITGEAKVIPPDDVILIT